MQAQFDRVLEALHMKLPTVADHLEAARADILAFTAFPGTSGARSGPPTLGRRLNREIRRRADVVLMAGILPNDDAITRLIGAVEREHVQQHDEWPNNAATSGST